MTKKTGILKVAGYICLSVILVFSLMTIAGCGGGGDDGGGVPVPPDPTTCEDVSGTWNTTEVDDATGCGEGFTTHHEEYTITQSGCNITIDGGLFGIETGTVSGSQITYTGSFPDEGGTTTGTVNLTISGNSLNGSSTWTWSDGTSSCSGTTTISGTKQQIAACGEGLPLTISDLSFPGTVTGETFYDGSVTYEGTYEDIVNPKMVSRFPVTGGYRTWWPASAPTVSNCSLNFSSRIPNLIGTGTIYFRLIDYDENFDDDYNWDNNSVANELSQPITIQ